MRYITRTTLLRLVAEAKKDARLGSKQAALIDETATTIKRIALNKWIAQTGSTPYGCLVGTALGLKYPSYNSLLFKFGVIFDEILFDHVKTGGEVKVIDR